MKVSTLRKIGFHTSIAGGLYKSFTRAQSLKCTTVQIFTRSPRSWKYKELNIKDIREFKNKRKETRINPVISHIPYLPNLSTREPVNHEKSRFHFDLEYKRCVALGIDYLVTHCGSHKGEGVKVGIETIAEHLIQVLDVYTTEQPVILLENTAGGRNSVGSNFEELAKIIESAGNDQRLGICYDTCHGFAAGVGDIRDPDGVEELKEELKKYNLLKRLHLVHLNDSRNEFNSKRDRHEHIGLGKIGMEGIKTFVNDRFFSKVPMIMETPINDTRDDKGNMKIILEMIKDSKN
ncbi:MAG: deoxyribonuclease IV [Candidatus Hodarchaeales archaeon]